MPDIALGDLERRLAAFDAATRKLSGLVTEPTPGHSSPGKSGNTTTRQAVDTAMPMSGNEEISGLRPAIAATGATGALTARHRQGDQPAIGFTSAHGRPNIPAAPAQVPVTAARRATTSLQHRPKTRPHWLMPVAGVLVVIGLAAVLLLPRQFHELKGSVWAETQTVRAPADGVVTTVLAPVGAQIAPDAGLLILTPTGETQTLTVGAPRAAQVVRWLVSQGAHVATDEPLVSLVDPLALRVVAPLPPDDQAARGDRIEILLPGSGQRLAGTVDQVLDAGMPGWWSNAGPPPQRIVIVVDPGPNQPTFGQGAYVVVLGRAGALRKAMFGLWEAWKW